MLGATVLNVCALPYHDNLAFRKQAPVKDIFQLIYNEGSRGCAEAQCMALTTGQSGFSVWCMLRKAL